jgi:hypothetical protein
VNGSGSGAEPAAGPATRATDLGENRAMPSKLRAAALCLSVALSSATAAASYAAATPSVGMPPVGTAPVSMTATHTRPGAGAGEAARAKAQLGLRAFKHVWLIVLENEDEANTFQDKTSDPYLAKTLERKGLLLTKYYGIGHASLDNYIALTSGQAPNASTQTDCQTYADFSSNATTPGEPDQQLGNGCVYPARVNDIASQLSAKHESWKAYMEDMGNIASRDHGAACGHPVVGSKDGTQSETKGDGYATRHDPFVYYHRIIDHKAFCRRHVVAQGKPDGAMPKAAPKNEHGLAYDLRRASRTPAYSFITPNLCDDGHDYPCKTGQRSYGSATKDLDHWVHTWVPKIMKSPAYRRGGLIEITFDESNGAQSDSSACCNEQPDPNAIGGMAGESGMGGGKVGALLLSPLLRGGRKSTTPYNHYSTLATDEAIFGLKRLGYAMQASTLLAALRADAR